MKSLVCAIIGMTLVCHSTGFLFKNLFGTSIQDAVGPLREDCISKALAGNCQFYTCFDERHPCESDNYALKYGWRFCSRFDIYYDRLTAQGKQWLNASRVCSMGKMLAYYRSATIDCDDVEDKMRDAHAKCEAENGLCGGQLLTNNREVFSDVYALNRRSAVHFLMSAKQCTLTKFREVVSWFQSQVGTLEQFKQSITPLLTEVKQHIKKIKANVREEIDRLTDTAETAEVEDEIESDDDQEGDSNESEVN